MSTRIFLPLFLAVAAGATAAAAQSPAASPGPLDAVFDSAVVIAALADLPALPPEVRPLFYVEFDSAGALDSIAGWSGLLPAYRDGVVALLTAHVRPAVAGARRRDLDVRAEGGPAPVFARHDTEYAAPEMLNPTMVNQALGRAVAQLQRQRRAEEQRLHGSGPAPLHRASPRLHRAQLKFRIDEEGRTGEITVDQSSGDGELDQALARIARRLRFRPAEIDGIPVPVWSVLPIQTYL